VTFDAPLSEVATPKNSVPLVETRDVFYPFEGSPRRVGRRRGDSCAQRRAVQGVGRGRVREERPRVEHVGRSGGTRTDEDVVVHVWFAVSVDAVGEGHDLRPLAGHVVVFTRASVAYHQGALFEVGQRVGDRASVRL
jgi:hypothetical protein